MSNQYFTSPSALAAGTKARAADVNAITQAVNSAFDKLPGEAAIKGGTINYAANTSTTNNAYAVTLDAKITSTGLFDGLEVKMLPTRANTGACTLNVNGLGAIAIKRADGTDPQAGDIVAGCPIPLTYQLGTNVFMLPPVLQSQVTQASSAVAAAAASAAAAAGSATDAANAATTVRVADYAALRAVTSSATAIYVSGYMAAAAPAGYAGVFVRDDTDTTSADNGGTIIVASNGKRWKRRFDGMLNVLWFGADPSYATNSSPAFQAAIMAGGSNSTTWNGGTIFVPKGTYRDQDGIVIGTFSGQNCYSVRLVGESTHGTVIQRPKGYSTGPILTVSGFHNLPESMTLISEVNAAGTDYSASHAVYIRGNPQAGTNGNGTKENAYRNLKIMRCGIGLQIGNYSVDGVDPDIETNLLTGIEISQCNGGIFYNGQNILHNHLLSCHIVDCRDYLVKQTRGGDFSAERCYFGGLYDYLTNNYNVPATEKILISNGNVYLSRCRSEDWSSSAGNLTPRWVINVTSTDSKIIHLVGNTFTTRDNASTEPCVNLSGQGTAGNSSCKAILEGNTFYGYVGINTIDVFSFGNSYLGTASGGNGVVDGKLRSANQKAQNFREVYFDSNQDGQVGQLTIKTASNNKINHIRTAVSVNSEWQGEWSAVDADSGGLNWARNTGIRVTNSTATQETAVHVRGVRNNGAFPTLAESFGSAAPTAGTWQLNDRMVVNGIPAGTDYFTCKTAGTPGTWVANRKRGTFTLGAAVTTTVSDTDVTATSVILLMPTNAAAATLMGSAKALYVSARTVGTSFAVSTASGVAAAGTETFEYQLLN
jgi:hypothetical protein